MANSPIITTSFFERIVLCVLNWACRRKDILNCEKQVYLRRWVVFRFPSWGLFVHKFERSDEDRALHDHPWSFIVIPIWRGYIEHSFGETKHIGGPLWGTYIKAHRVWPLLDTRFRKARYAHRVELLPRPISEHDAAICNVANLDLPAWSLFFVFRRWRKWGFFMPNGWQENESFLKEHCE